MLKTATASLLALALCSVWNADADIIALKADDSAGGYTTSTPILADSPAEGVQPSAGGNDNLWGFSSSNNQALLDGTDTESGLGGQVWVSRADLGEDNPTLTTTLSGLDAGGEYSLYLYHVTSSSVNDDWGMEVYIDGLTSVTTYRVGDGVLLGTSGNTQLERVFLGTVTGSATYDIILDDLASTNDRSFYKGLGVEVVPEPGSLALLGLGGLLIARRRRG